MARHRRQDDRRANCPAVDVLPALYIADGHHRSAAAARVAEARKDEPKSVRYFLSVLFPAHEMTILGYHRVLQNLNGLDAESLLAALRKEFAVEPSANPGRARIGRRVRPGDGRQLVSPHHPPGTDPGERPVGRLPITLLTRHVIEPLFGIADQRKDKRIDFVGGGRGLAELARRVASGEKAAAFALYPTQMADLIAVADTGEI